MASQIDPTTIDVTYPIAGQDNDTRGFHDNFRAIQNGLVFARSEISDLQSTITGTISAVNVNVSSNVYVTGNVTASKLTLTSVLQFANLTTAEINAISPAARGMTAYNYTTGNIQVYNGTKWANVTLS